MPAARAGRNASLWVVRVSGARRLLRSVEGAVPEMAARMALWRDARTRLCRLDVYLDDGEGARRVAERISSLVPACSGGSQSAPSVERVKPENWQESWKSGFRAMRVSPRIVVRPSWERPSLRAGVADVEIDPGMSFGTGSHGTTRGCLGLIDRLGRAQRGASLVDIGCGSGILAIAAAKLGFRCVTAMDHDPVAVRVARENLRKNGVSRRVRLAQADIGSYAPGRTFDVVVANLVSGLLCREAVRITGLAAQGDGARLVLSGILRRQKGGVLRCYEGLGWRLEAERPEAEWCTLCLRRDATARESAGSRSSRGRGGTPAGAATGRT